MLKRTNEEGRQSLWGFQGPEITWRDFSRQFSSASAVEWELDQTKGGKTKAKLKIRKENKTFWYQHATKIFLNTFSVHTHGKL